MNYDVKAVAASLFLVSQAYCVACSNEQLPPLVDDPFAVRSNQTVSADGSIISLDPATEDSEGTTSSVVKGATATAPSNGCNLTGRWISVQRTENMANFNASLDRYELSQIVYSWAYWEISQSGTQVIVQKGLQCGSQMEVIPRVPLASDTSMATTQKFLQGVTQNNAMDGRRGTYSPISGSNQCQLMIGKGVLLEGATVSYFKDYTRPFAEVKTAADGVTPGWEDWDQDGNPGVTYRVSGIAVGDLYTSRREVTEYRGTVEKNAKKFMLDVTYQNEHVVISTNPTAVKWPVFKVVPEGADNYVWFAKVDNVAEWDVAANASDLAICVKVRQVKGALLPEAQSLQL